MITDRREPTSIETDLISMEVAARTEVLRLRHRLEEVERELGRVRAEAEKALNQ